MPVRALRLSPFFFIEDATTLVDTYMYMVVVLRCSDHRHNMSMFWVGDSSGHKKEKGGSATGMYVQVKKYICRASCVSCVVLYFLIFAVGLLDAGNGPSKRVKSVKKNAHRWLYDEQPRTAADCCSDHGEFSFAY